MRTAITSFIVLCICIFFTSAACAESNATGAFDAKNHYDNGRYVEAISICEKVLLEQPESTDARRILAHSLFRLGRVDESLQQLFTLIKRGCVTQDIAERIVQICRGKEDYHGMLFALYLLNVFVPDNYDVRLCYADTLALIGDCERAISEYNSLIAIHGDNADLYVRLGGLLLKKKNYEGAVKALCTSYYLAGTSANIERAIIELHLFLEDYQNALRWCDIALRGANAGNNEIELARAETLISLALYEEAAVALLKLSKSDMPIVKQKSFNLLGRLEYANGRLDSAASYWVQYVDAGGGEHEILRFLLNYFYQHCDYAKALKFIASLNGFVAEDEMIVKIRFSCLLHLGDQEGARGAAISYIAQKGLDNTAKDMVKQVIQASQK